MQETKKYTCPGCGAALEFNPQTQRIRCEHCGHAYTVEEFADIQQAVDDRVKEYNLTENEDNDAARQTRRETIPMQVLHCSSCGAELVVTRTEASTYCSFCGQATVIADRVTGCLKPDKIIPFKVTREVAEQRFRKRLAKGWFIPKEIKNFEQERLNGIYLPFWLFDVYYGAAQYWRYVNKKDAKKATQYLRVGFTMFHRITIDASSQIPNEYSRKLEPYRMKELEDFDAAYLSGFYSDRFDVKPEEVSKEARDRAEALFNEGMRKFVKKGSERYLSFPVSKASDPEYALLPVWFLTFRYEDSPITLMMNGQTGKIVGGVPYNQRKVTILQIVLMILFGGGFAALCYLVIPYFFMAAKDAVEVSKMIYASIVYTILAVAGLSLRAETSRKRYIDSCDLTQGLETEQYAKERQEK